MSGSTTPSDSGSQGLTTPKPAEFIDSPRKRVIQYARDVNPVCAYVSQHSDLILSRFSDLLDTSRADGGIVFHSTASRSGTGQRMLGVMLLIKPELLVKLRQEIAEINPDLLDRLPDLQFIMPKDCHLSILIKRGQYVPKDAIQDPDSKDAPVMQDAHITIAYRARNAPGLNKHIRVYFDTDGNIAYVPADLKDDESEGIDLYQTMKICPTYQFIVAKLQELVAAALEDERSSKSAALSAASSPLATSPPLLLSRPTSTSSGHEKFESPFESNMELYYYFSVDVASAIQREIIDNDLRPQTATEKDPFDFMPQILEKWGFTFDNEYGSDYYFLDNIIYQDGILFDRDEAGEIYDLLAKNDPQYNIVKKLFIIDMLITTLPLHGSHGDLPALLTMLHALRDVLAQKVSQMPKSMEYAFVEDYARQAEELRVKLNLNPGVKSSVAPR